MNRQDLGRLIAEEVAAGRAVTNLHELPDKHRYEALFAFPRAVQAGATSPLTFAGSGVTGIVLCDGRGHAFKVGKNLSSVIEDEAEWLATAADVLGVREHVADFIRYHPDLNVIERECVQGDHVPWDYPLRDLHDATAARMREYEWGSPEFKYDSYVMTEDRGPVLVDAGFAVRHGERLVDYVEDVLEGRRVSSDSVNQLAWDLRQGFDEPRPERVDRLLSRLYAMGADR